MRKHVILFLAAHPSGTDPLKLGEECAEIQREISSTPYRDDFRFESRWVVGVDELMRDLMELDPTVIHFSGHDGHRSGLVLQDGQGRPQPVSARALAMILETAARSTRVVVLDTCHTAAQADTLRSMVDCVVSMAGTISDAASRAFTTRFYGALGNRRSIADAVAAGVAALADKQFPDEMPPRCVARDDIDPHEVILHPVGATSAPPDPAGTARPQGHARADLAAVLWEMGDLRPARAMYEQALTSHLHSYGDDHPAVAATRASLAWLLMELNDQLRARELFEQALASNLRIYNEDHPEVAVSRGNLAVLLTALGESSTARTLFEQALASNLKTYGPEHPEVAKTRANLGALLIDGGELTAAQALLEQALASNLETYGPRHPDVATIHAHLGCLFEARRDLVTARRHYMIALASDLTTYGVDHPKAARRTADVRRLTQIIDDVQLSGHDPDSTPVQPHDRWTSSGAAVNPDEGTVYIDSLIPGDSAASEDATRISSLIDQDRQPGAQSTSRAMT